MLYLSVALMQPQSSTDERRNGYVCTHMHAHVHVYMCLSICGDQRTVSKVIPLCHWFWTLDLVLHQKPPSRLGWLARKSHGSTHLCLHNAGISCACHHFWLLLPGFWGPNSTPFNYTACTLLWHVSSGPEDHLLEHSFPYFHRVSSML